MIWNLPNTLTWLRIFAIPLVILLFYLPFKWADPAAGLLFALAGITDSLDGYLARRMGLTSRLGAFLDPVADKLIVAVALVLLVSKEIRCGPSRYAPSSCSRPSSSSAAKSPSRRCASGWPRLASAARSR
ncbi:MAG: CDP-diacylglycerol--glycerol-3-phosphate 3-phosphatidyltransferase [Steroidobacteraceae bacterium]|nr:CDP-diacylglycerol--glycerol-3-phosphate 3-phosphatidyltransferase [Steroidobacteraceae bacterium]